MVLQCTLDGLIFICVWIHCTYPSLFYVFAALCLSITKIFLPNSTSLVYIILLIISSTFLIFKLLIKELSLFYSPFTYLITKDEDLSSLIPDAVALMCSIIGVSKILMKNPFWGLKYQKILGFLVLSLSCIVFQSYYSFLYLSCLIYWLISYFLLKVKKNLPLSTTICLTATVHLVYPSLVALNFTRSRIPEDIFSLDRYGALELFLVFLLQILFCSISSCEKVEFSHKNPLLLKPRELTAYDKLKAIMLYNLAFFAIWLWILNSKGIIGLFLMFWLFYSILQDKISKLHQMTIFLLFPTVIIALLMNYASYVLQFQFEGMEMIYYCSGNVAKNCCLMISSLTLVTLWLYFSKKYPMSFDLLYESKSEISRFLISRIYVFSLIVLFLVGLSDINLLHIGLMSLCIWFMISRESLKHYWKLLLIYTMILIFLRYSWMLIQPFYTGSHKVLEIIGLQSADLKTSTFIPYDYLLWILLLTASVQNFANKIKSSQKSPKTWLIKCISVVYSYFSHFEIWIMYTVLILVQFISPINFLNLLRLFILLCIMYKHLSNTHNKILVNYEEVYKYLVVLEVYCGILLAIRYVFQFLMLIPEIYNIEFPTIGFQVYDKKMLYASTASDCGLFIASVFASRNCSRLREDRELMITKDSYSKSKFFSKYFSKPFQYLVILYVFYVAIYDRLSICMLINIVAISYYEIYIAFYFTSVSCSKTSKNKEKEFYARSVLFGILYANTTFCVLLAYSRFLISPSFLSENLVSSLEWLFFLLGFTKGKENGVLVHAYLYIILLVLLILERHCLQYIYPSSLHHVGRGWNSCRVSFKINREDNRESFKHYIDFIRALTLFKAIYEALVPMMFLLLAFEKLTLVSIFYVVLVLMDFCSKSLKNTRFLYIVLILLSISQYAFILSNINKTLSEYFPETEPPFQIPWFIVQNPLVSNFLITGTLTQLKSIFYDMIVQVFILIYYFYFSCRERQLVELERIYEALYAGSRETEEVEYDYKGWIGLIKEFLIRVKKAFYLLSRYLVVGIALLFITRSLGLLSAVYCIFCLVFIIKESSIYLTMNITSYLNLLTSFLRFLVLDLTLQIFIQLPFTFISSSAFETWCQYIGLMKLIKTNEKDTLEANYLTILFKIYTFFIVLVVNLMMQSKDYKDHINRVFEELQLKSKSTAEAITQQFNNERLKMNKFYSEASANFNEELKKIQQNIVIWNQKYKSSGKSAARSREFLKNSSKKNNTDTGVERKFVSKLNTFLVSLINPHLFQQFVNKISTFSHISKLSSPRKTVDRSSKESTLLKLNTKKLTLETVKSSSSEDSSDSESQKISLKSYANSKNQVDSSSSSNENNALNSSWSVKSENAVNFKDSLKEDNIEYDFKWNDYLAIVVYGIASNTQAMVYVAFFMNHWKYASLESIVFPLSAIGYATLEYPRPPPAYFRSMMVYTELVFFIKFSLHLEVWNEILGKEFLENFKDPFKIGFNLAKNTYSEELHYYVLWDVIVMIALLLHNYYLLKIGLWKHTEREIETLRAAKERLGYIVVPQFSQRSKPKSFLNRFLPKNKEEKPGKDYYFFMISMQMLILVYIFCFFTRMDGNAQDISQAIRSNQFQGRMVMSLIVQVAIMVIERYFYINRTSQALKDAQANETLLITRFSIQTPTARFRTSTVWTDTPQGRIPPLPLPRSRPPTLAGPFMDIQKIETGRNIPLYLKVSLHILLVISVHAIVFWYLPISGNNGTYGTFHCEDRNDADRCNNFEVNLFVKGFYLLYMIYLMFAAFQIRYGLPSFSTITFPLMRNNGAMNYYLFLAYRWAPFLFEIRTLMDWIFTNTALSIFQWFKFEDIYAQLFINECYQKSLQYKKNGEKVSGMQKCSMGVCGLVIILVILMIPLLIFSTLNPITELNPVTSASLDVNFVYKNRIFNLYTIKSVEEIKNITSESWEKEFQLSKISQLSLSDREKMQQIIMPVDSDTLWTITPPSRRKLCSLIKYSEHSALTAEIQVKYSFIRAYPNKTPEVSMTKSVKIKQDTLERFYDVICENKNITIIIEKIFNQIIRLPSNGDTINPIIIEDEKFTADLILEIEEENSKQWWNVSAINFNNDTKGVSFFTVSDNYSMVTLNFSILTFYISIVYVLGTLIKYATRGTGSNVVWTDMKYTKDLQVLCEGIYISRMIGKLKEEEELYFELLDLLRSPEITKMITGSSSIKLEANTEPKKTR